MAYACVLTPPHGQALAVAVAAAPWAPSRLRPGVCAAAARHRAGNCEHETSGGDVSLSSTPQDNQALLPAPTRVSADGQPGPGGHSGDEVEHEAHKQLNARICSASSADEVLAEVGTGGQHLVNFNMVNATTAFHRLAKVGGLHARR